MFGMMDLIFCATQAPRPTSTAPLLNVCFAMTSVCNYVAQIPSIAGNCSCYQGHVGGDIAGKPWFLHTSFALRKTPVNWATAFRESHVREALAGLVAALAVVSGGCFTRNSQASLGRSHSDPKGLKGKTHLQHDTRTT